MMLLTGRGAAGELPLEKSVIMVGEKADVAEQYAARELQRVLEVMTGAKLPVVHQLEEGATGFVIGTPESSPLIGRELFRSDNEEEIRVVRQKELVTLAGPTPRAALYATYAFLEEVLGVRWLWPGESGEFIPKAARLEMGDIDIAEIPDMTHRGLVITNVRHGYDEETDRWMARNRLNNVSFNPASTIPDELVRARLEKGFLLRLAGHNAFLPRKLLDEHPEYLAEVGGRRLQSAPNMRPPQLCWSNPEVVQAMADRMKAWCQRHPYIRMVNFIPADHGRYCECATCTAQGSVSERWQQFSAAVIAEVRKEYPQIAFGSLAYMGYRSAPAKGEAAPFETLGYAYYNGCYRHDPERSDAIGDKPAEEIRLWQERGARMGLRGYEFILAKEPVLIPLVSWEMEQFRWANRLKMNSYSSEIPPYGYPREQPEDQQRWSTNRMNVYAAAKAMWNSRITARELVRDWTRTIYGAEGAEAMMSYYWMMDDAWRSAPEHITMFHHPAHTLAKEIMTPELLEQAAGAIRSARAAIGNTAEGETKRRALAQVMLEEKMLANWRQSYQYQLNRQGEWLISVAKSQGPLSQEASWREIAPLAAFEDKQGKRASQQTDVRMLWSEEGLHLRIVCHDPNTTKITTLYKEHDQKLYSDESVEIFLNPDPSSSGYRHLIVNAAGARYDAKTDAGMDFDLTWNPEWSAKVSRSDTAWTIDATLPFAAMDVKPMEGMEWKFAIKRSRPKESGQAHSGWPDASYHSPGAFGTIRFVSKATDARNGSVVLLGGRERGEGLKVEFLKQDWKVAVVEDGDGLVKELAAKPSGVVIRWLPGMQLSKDHWQQHVIPYLKDGGRVIISGSDRVPLRRWLPLEGAEVEGSGRIDPLRRTASLAEDAWLREPNNLESIMRSGRTPPAAFTPLNDSWKVLASCQLQDEGEAAYLLQRAVGDGFVFLTSSGLGYGGGYEMFGHRNVKNAFQLLENLFAKQAIFP